MFYFISLVAQDALSQNRSVKPYFQIDTSLMLRRMIENGANGFSTAQLGLSVYYNDKKAQASASYWLLQAARSGIPAAMFALAGSYASGKGVTADVSEAVKWYILSALLGHPIAKDIVKKAVIIGVSNSNWYRDGSRRADKWGTKSRISSGGRPPRFHY